MPVAPHVIRTVVCHAHQPLSTLIHYVFQLAQQNIIAKQIQIFANNAQAPALVVQVHQSA
jgi:hypothetical protein